ncbi:MAG: hypothetical protein N3A65_01610 [candidate division WOR-3 bacterium]|nr:hypothetical protein [candidate division WOR-3 bacterium]
MLNTRFLLVLILFKAISVAETNTNINVKCIVWNSLTKDSIPYIQVHFERLNKSFTTRRSTFYLSLPPGEYEVGLEAP